jgi:hypothetical protein
MKSLLVARLMEFMWAGTCAATALAIWLSCVNGCPAAESNSAATTLRRYQVEPSAAGVLGVLRQWLPDAENRARIARLIRELGDDNWAVREAASRQLAGMGTLAEAAIREAAAQSRDAEVISRARKLLAGGQQGNAEELLLAALAWLRQSPTPQATPLLLDLLPVLPETYQPSLCEALWASAVPGDAPRLRRAIGDARPAVRIAAIPAMEQAAGVAAVKELEPLLRDSSEATRLAAARALLDRLPQPSISVLLELLDSRQPGVRQEAAWLLQQASGIVETPVDLAIAAAQWKTWAASEAAAHPRPLGAKRLQARRYAQPPFVPGRLGNAVAFNGKDNYIDCGNPPDNHLDIGTNATIEAWVRFDALPTNGQPAVIVGKNEGSGFQNKWVFGYATVHQSLYQGVMQGMANATELHINSPSTGPIFLHSKSWTPVIGQWYHLAVVKRGNRYTFYRNGVADGTDSTAVAIPRVNFALWMGRSEEASLLQGALDDVRIWNTDLTADQIHARMNSELTGTEPGLVGYWTLDEGSGTATADSTRFHANGTYKGGVR